MFDTVLAGGKKRSRGAVMWEKEKTSRSHQMSLKGARESILSQQAYIFAQRGKPLMTIYLRKKKNKKEGEERTGFGSANQLRKGRGKEEAGCRV